MDDRPATGMDDLPRAVTRSGSSSGLCFLAGVAAAAVGLVPWLLAGPRLPVQNLWADPDPGLWPVALLPFSQYAITTLIGLLVVGSAAGGLLGRAVSSGGVGLRGFGALVAGVLVVQLTAVAQTAAVVRAGLRPGGSATLYLAALVGVCVLAVLVGVLVMGLVGRARPGGAVVGMGIGALALAPWLGALFVPLGTITPDPAAMALVQGSRWVPAVLVGAAVGWAGLGTLGRVLAAVVDLLLLWWVPALTTAISSAAGTRVLAHQPTEMARYAVEVFVAAATLPALVLPPVLVAVVVAAIGLLARWLPRRGRPRP